MTATTVKPFSCYLCEKWQGERHKAYVMHFTDGKSVDICEACADDAQESRKYESIEAIVLDKMAGLSMEDDYMSAEGWGYCGRFDNWLLFQDTQGFVSAEEFKTDEAAEKQFDRLYRIGWGYGENDATIYQDRGRTYVYFDSKQIAALDNEYYKNPVRRAKAIISLEMRRTGYYPNVWIGDDRGMHWTEVW